MTDPRKLDAEAAALIDAPLPLGERLVQYAKLFLAGALVIAAIGAIVGAVGSPSIPVAIGYTAVFVGVVMLLAGGASGGGYANLGMGIVDRLADNAKRDRSEYQPDDATPVRRSKRYAVEEERGRRDPMERLRKGLRPEKNPTAFWTVIGGFVYIALGAFLALL